MNLENYFSNILITLIGMGVVFLFLGFLSMVMYCLTNLRPFKTKKTIDKSALDKKINSTRIAFSNNKNENNGEIPGWLLAAVAAYLSQKKDEFPVKASLWRYERIENKNGWMVIHKIQTKKAGTF